MALAPPRTAVSRGVRPKRQRRYTSPLGYEGASDHLKSRFVRLINRQAHHVELVDLPALDAGAVSRDPPGRKPANREGLSDQSADRRRALGRLGSQGALSQGQPFLVRRPVPL